MNKFVFLSFIFMGWVFFELSGGGDFKPPVNPALTGSASTPLALPEPDEPINIVTTALVLPARTVVASAVMARDSERDEPAILVDLTETPPVTLVSLEQSSEGFGGLLADFDPNVIRLSTTVVGETEEPAPDIRAEQELPPADLRRISGTRVNMRHGPGTTYDIVARLKLGQEVEVLSESGTGWLRLRLVSDRTVGWISASLVSKPLR
ncbi:MAG: hypothetical protein ACI92Z_001885 [Paracoccaceae bacterium]|jgi:hypothetical protein